MKSILKFAGIAAIALGSIATPASAGWGNNENSDVAVAAALDDLLQQANRSVPLPAIVNFFEKRMVTMLYELRDDPNYRTHTYVLTINGDFIKICDSVGFGINASIQLTNPVRPVDITETPQKDYAGVVLDQAPQAEPNGLFMPEGLAATYVMCVNPADNELAPVYMEPDIIVSPFTLPIGS